jgi:hypothetical protein
VKPFEDLLSEPVHLGTVPTADGIHPFGLDIEAKFVTYIQT